MVIGLTGSIASGKSAVTQILRDKAAYIIDADEVYRTIFPSISTLIASEFPHCTRDTVLDKQLLKNAVFNDSQQLKKLNAITHPHILREINIQLKQAKNDAVVVVPLLFESGFNKLCDVTVGVICQNRQRMQRLLQRDSITTELAEKIIQSQKSDNDLIELCDYIIYNNGSLDELKYEVERVFSQIRT